MTNTTKTKPAKPAAAKAPTVTRRVGFTKEDGTTDTHDVYVGPDGDTLQYTRGSVLVIDQYERELAAASLAADADAIGDIQARYEDARREAVTRLHQRAARKDRG